METSSDTRVPVNNSVKTVYRPPSVHTDYLCKLDSIFQDITTLYDDVIILGDFNLDLKKEG